MSSFLNSLPAILPTVHVWAEKQEALILESGDPLTGSELADARRAGVAQPEKIRVLRVDTLPLPDNEDIRFVAKQIGLFSHRVAGITLGYGICLSREFHQDRLTLVHECVHVSQYEKKGGLLPFLTDYLRECIAPGYPFGALEQEALLVSRDVCRGTS